MTDFLDDFIARKAAGEVWVACSGGLDSMVLLELVRRYPGACQRGVLHFNHGLRVAARDDELLVYEQAVVKAGLPLVLGQARGLARLAAGSRGLSLESAARQSRYHFFYGFLRRRPQALLLTAHHADDQVETMLFNLMRGSGLRGLKGIPRQRGRIGRPLLTISRSQLEEFARQEELQWLEDESNAALEFSRNRIRHELMPRLRQLGGPGVEKRIAAAGLRLAADLAVIDSCLDDLKPLIRKTAAGSLEVERRLCQDLPRGLRPHLLTLMLRRAGFRRQVGARVLDTLVTLVGEPGQTAPARFDLGDGLRFSLSAEGLCLAPATAVVSLDEMQLAACGSCDFAGGRLEIREVDGVEPTAFAGDPRRELIDAEALVFPLTLRGRRPGDRFQPLGLDGGSRKLKKFLCELKLSPAERERQPLLFDAGGRMIWVVGRRLDQRFGLRPETRRQALLTFSPAS